MLGSPIGAVVGATDVDAMVAFLSPFDVASEERGLVRVVKAPPGSPRSPYDGGLAALDFYARSVADHPSVRIDLGPLVMHQARLTGPDGLPVVLIDANHRRPSRLDTTDAEFSEAHSLVWVVPDVGETVAFFVEAGMTLAFDLPLESAAVSEVMGLPSVSPVRMAMVSDEALSPMRLELFGFPDRVVPPAAARPVAGGAWPVFEVDDLSGALALPWARVGEVVDGVVRCVAPGGVLVELWG